MIIERMQIYNCSNFIECYTRLIVACNRPIFFVMKEDMLEM